MDYCDFCCAIKGLRELRFSLCSSDLLDAGDSELNQSYSSKAASEDSTRLPWKAKQRRQATHRSTQ